MKVQGKNHRERWLDCYNMGRSIAPHLETFATVEEVSRAFGFKRRQQAHWAILVALGRAAIRARKLVREEKR